MKRFLFQFFFPNINIFKISSHFMKSLSITEQNTSVWMQMKDLTKISCYYLEIKSHKRIEHLEIKMNKFIGAHALSMRCLTHSDIEQMTKKKHTHSFSSAE